MATKTTSLQKICVVKDVNQSKKVKCNVDFNLVLRVTKAEATCADSVMHC